MDRFILISGCSGGGKSTLLAELGRRGYAVIEEPGRRIVAEERETGGRALPWVDLAAFAERAIALALEDLEKAARLSGPVFFDRGLIDAAVALEHAAGRPCLDRYAARRYHRRIFVTPPWPEIYAGDIDRRHDLPAAIDEYERLLRAFGRLDHMVELLPRIGVEERADLILGRLGADQTSG